MSDKMTDEAVRAELERIGDIRLLVDWDTDKRRSKGQSMRYALRRLAELHAALGEIYKKTKRIIGPPSDGPYDFDSDCKTCVKVEDIAYTVWKGGSNG